jgi:hypothetical protein
MGLRGYLAVLLALSCCVLSPASAELAAPQTAPIEIAKPGGGELSAAAPEKVVVGAFINRIQELDFRTQSYSVDLYVWFRWRNSDFDPSKSLEFMNRFAPFEHVRTQIYDKPLQLPDGSFYSIVRNQGRFSTRLGLERFPFDQQQLVIELEDSASGTGLLNFVPDDNPITLSSSLAVTGFRIGEPRLDIRANEYPTNFGNPTVGAKEAYSRATLVVPISRPLTALVVKTFLPILLVMVCAGLVLFIRPAYIDARVGLSMTALFTLLLTLVALQLARSTSQSEIDYLTMIDKVYLASYGFIILVLLRIVRVSWRDHDAQDELVIARTDRLWLLIVAIFYIVTLASILATSLWR